MARFLFSILIGFLCGLWEAGVSPFLPGVFSIHPLLPVLVLFVIASGRSRSLAAAFAGGVMIDLFQPGFSDAAFLRYVLVVLLLDVISRHWLTNRSIYSAAALVLAGRFMERISAWLIGVLFQVLDFTPYAWSVGARGWIPYFWDAAIVALGFLGIAILTKRFLTLPQRGQGH